GAGAGVDLPNSWSNVTNRRDAAWRGATGGAALRGLTGHFELGNFLRLEDRQHTGLSCDHEPGADAAVAIVGRFFSRSGADGRRKLESVAAGRGDAAQSTELRRRWRAAAADARGRIPGGLGPWPNDELVGYG